MEAVQRGLSARPVRRPARQRPEQSYLDRMETLRTWRKKTAQALKIESDVVLPRDIMEAVAAKNPTSLETLQAIMAEVPWRCSAYGSLILDQLVPPSAAPVTPA